MAYRVELTRRAQRDVGNIYLTVDAENSGPAREWFNGMEAAVLSLQENPLRCPVTPEDPDVRHLLYGRRGRRYRIIFSVDHDQSLVSVIHVRHGSRAPFGEDEVSDN